MAEYPLFNRITGIVPYSVRHADEQAKAERAFQKQARLDELTTASSLRKDEEEARLAAARKDVEASEQHTKANLIAAYGPVKGLEMFNDLVGQKGYTAHKENLANQLLSERMSGRIGNESQTGALEQLAEQEKLRADAVNSNNLKQQGAAFDANLAGQAQNSQNRAINAISNLETNVNLALPPELLAAAKVAQAKGAEQTGLTTANTQEQLRNPIDINNNGLAASYNIPPTKMTGGVAQALNVPPVPNVSQIALSGLNQAKAQKLAGETKLVNDMLGGGTTATPTNGVPGEIETGTGATSSAVPGEAPAALPSDNSNLGAGSGRRPGLPPKYLRKKP